MSKSDWKTGEISKFERRIVIYEPTVYNLSVIKTLESVALKILFVFGEKLQDDNCVQSSTIELAAELRRSTRQTRRGLNELKRVDFVQKKKGKTYKVNPGIFRVSTITF